MAKMAKVKQTDYTTGGRDISNTAIPLYENALNQYYDLSSNYQSNLDDIIQKYYSNTADQSDFLRNYNRTMANATARNYAATGGGYSSAGQRAYADNQRSMNDLATRLYQQGITGGQSILNNQLSAINTGLGQYNSAYQLGKAYSDVDQYNDLVDQNNSWLNQMSQGLGTVGTLVGSAIAGPAGAAVGNAIGNAAGSALGTDTSGAFASIGASGGGSNNNAWNTLGNVVAQNAGSIQSGIKNLFGGSKLAPVPNS